MPSTASLQESLMGGESLSPYGEERYAIWSWIYYWKFIFTWLISWLRPLKHLSYYETSKYREWKIAKLIKNKNICQASSRFTAASIVLLGLSSLFNDVAFYWVVLIFFLQRGPIAPLSEEVTDPDGKYVALGVLVLFLGLLVCLPYPFPFTDEVITSF